MRTVIFMTASALLATAAFAQTTGTPSGSAGSTTMTPPASPSGTMSPDPTDTAPPSTMAPGSSTSRPESNVTAASGMTMEGGKWMKDGRKATKAEIAAHKKTMAPM